MRVRLGLVLIALLAIVVMPSEAALVEDAGSVVDQVSSCVQPSGLLREVGADGSVECGVPAPMRPAVALVAVLVGLLGALATVQLVDRRARRVDRWHLGVAVAPAGAPWRAPPVAV